MRSDLEGQMMRALQLLRLRRYGDAEAAIRELLSQGPNDAFLLHRLAVAQLNQEGKEKTALATIDAAIGCEPAESELHAFRSVILNRLNREKEAISAAEEAISLDPASPFAFVAKASALMGAGRHSEAEVAAREALALDPDDGSAANILSHALRIQGKSAENEGRIAAMLARAPEDDDNHCAAGWQALQSGRREEAQKHFMEALRLNPENDAAREGMLEAFKAKSPFYRGYLRWVFWMASQSQARQWAMVIGIFLISRSFRALSGTPYATLGAVLGVLFWLVVMWTHVARGVGNFFVLRDKQARHALTKRQRREAIAVGGGIFVGSGLLAVSLVVKFFLPPEIDPIAFLGIIPGVTLILASFPFAYTFTNDAPVGRWVMGAAAAFVLLTGGILFAGMAAGSVATAKFAIPLIVPALITIFVVTLLANFRFFRR
jgi:tetratricopeptide (TPR) repeat protein